MTYTDEEYAEMAIKANEEGKVLKNINGKLMLVDSEPIALTNEQIVSQNQTMKISLINEVNEKIAILQDVIDLDMQESNEEEQLKQWKKYRILLTRVDASDVNVVFPEKP
ncbi:MULTISPECIES: tail fiber assembly protein [unclassified Gilliamella]|uniref:tail fiber assembly protein n=1 Tax=unclassified Gilliamella TaxID=2685620 RepID=UPI00226ABA0F|nr:MULTISPECIES: tail fiber assembly protein [unclassified Gilliamella]MCX8587581.1 tail fiber assembly protein [Gilliamella sp. B3801]MCX8591807.1 tail fiber assembly protein [Gilliamella sp. B3804]